MKYIYYLSSANSDLFPNNSTVHFSNTIQQHYLESLPDGDLEAALKLISFDNTRRSGLLRQVERLALKSNLSSKILSSGEWDNIFAWFSLGASSFDKKYLTFEFENPSFYPTTKELISRASFELVNLYNNTKPSVDTCSEALIQIVVRKPQKRMKHPFYIHLDSACTVSKSFFPGNTSTDFTIKLPDRMEFRRDWIITLKSLSLQNSFFNVFDCYITMRSQTYRLKDGIYTDGEIILGLSKLMEGILQFRGIPEQAPNGGRVFARAVKNLEEDVIFSNNLSLILGLSTDQERIKLKDGELFIAKSKLNSKALLPRQLVVNCDIIENSLFGGEMRQILRIITLPEQNADSFYNFEFQNNEYLKIENNSFDKIQIRITDLNGMPIMKAQNWSTRLQVMFVNINSL